MKVVVKARRAARYGAKALWALVDRHHPVLAHVIPIRRCNLACSYCNEYDAVSRPVPPATMKRRLDLLADLGTSVVTISGGEPLLHPELETLVRHGRDRGMGMTLITNGYLLSRKRIGALNAAGLDHLQISIDNVEPDETSFKSLRLLEPKLRWLSQHALFSVAINSVVGAEIGQPEDALAVAKRARELGFMSSVGILHDPGGQLRPLGERAMAVYRALQDMQGRGLTRYNSVFQDNLAKGRPNSWSCRAGSRYLYLDEHGLVHYCSQQRGRPAVPLEDYTREHLRQEFDVPKKCAPYCTVNCVQQVAFLDGWRRPQVARQAVRVPETSSLPGKERSVGVR